jgi:hypothetical protein
MENIENMYVDDQNIQNFLYDIKIFQPNDVINLFKTVYIDENTSNYIYTAMSNPLCGEFIDEISNMYINKGIYFIFFDILDGWTDYVVNSKKHNKELIKEKISKTLVKLLRTDSINCDKYYIDFLNKNFSISYYAETMMG